MSAPYMPLIPPIAAVLQKFCIQTIFIEQITYPIWRLQELLWCFQESLVYLAAERCQGEMSIFMSSLLPLKVPNSMEEEQGLTDLVSKGKLMERTETILLQDEKLEIKLQCFKIYLFTGRRKHMASVSEKNVVNRSCSYTSQIPAFVVDYNSDNYVFHRKCEGRI